MSDFATRCIQTTATADLFEGMMNPPSIALFQAFLDYQDEKNIHGDMIEFGVYRGRSASILLGNLRTEEKTILVDVKDYPELDNLGKISKSFEFIKGKSEDLVHTEAFQARTDGKFRFSHHDASHSFHNVTEEVLYMQERLGHRGILVLDDFGNSSYIQVVAACFTHLTRQDNKLKFLLYSDNKAYLCLKEDFPFYEDFVANHLLARFKEVNLDFFLTRTEKTDAYSGFSLWPKTKADQPDLYGTHIYGMRYYTVPPVE